MNGFDALIKFLTDLVGAVCTDEKRTAFLTCPPVEGIRIDSWAPEGRTVSVCVTEGDATVGVLVTPDGRFA